MPEGAFYWLGPPRVELAGEAIRLETRKITALLALLSVDLRPHSRERLAAMFWPEYDSIRAPANLRRALTSLQRSLGSAWVFADRDIVEFRRKDDVHIDMADYSTSIHELQNLSADGQSKLDEPGAGKLRSALVLYRGEFLEGLNLRDCPQFDHWQLLIREEAAQLAAWGLQRLVEFDSFGKRWQDAQDEAHKWLALDNLNETAHRALMFLYARTGKRSAALHQFESCRRLLREELDQDPDEETLALAERIRLRKIDSATPVKPYKEAPNTPRTSISQEQALPIKFSRPRIREKRVQRPGLFSILERGLERPLTLISAPAGFGKTTLLCGWMGKRELPAVWLSLEEEDDQAARLCELLAKAINAFGGGLGAEALGMLKSVKAPPLTKVVDSIIGDLTDHPAFRVLVLDDFHLASQPDTQKLFQRFVEHLPEGIHLFIATRVDPTLPLSKFRARDELMEVRAGDLRFSPEETAFFLREVMNIELAAEDIETLEQRTEGWPAGLQMAALSLRGRSDHSAFIKNFGGSHQYIMDYLMDEVLTFQPKEVQVFLLKTSILKAFCAGLCESITGVPGAQEILETLDRENLFLVSLDETRTWYRYHHLFAELLQHHLGQNRSQGEVSELHLSAGNWLEKSGDVEGAMDQYLKGKLHGEALRILVERHDEMISRGGLVTMVQWASDVPHGEVWKNPEACVAYGTIYAFAGRGEEAEGYFTQATALLKEDGGGNSRKLLGEASAISAFMADVRGENVKAVELAKKANELLPPEIHMGRALAAYVMSKEQRRQGDYDGADVWCVKLINHARAAKSIWPLAGAVYERGALRLIRGKMREAEKLLDDFLREDREPGSEGPCAKIYALKAEIELERGNVRQAQELIGRAEEDVMPWGLPSDMAACLLTKLRCKLSMGLIQEAQEDLDRIDTLVRTSQIYATMAVVIEAERVRIFLSGGSLTEAQGWLREYRPSEAWSPSLWEIHTISQARVLIALGQNSVARGLLIESAEKARKAGRHYRFLEILILLAASGTDDEAAGTLKEALELAEPEGYVRAFHMEGKIILRRVRAIGEEIGSLQPRLLKHIHRILSTSPIS